MRVFLNGMLVGKKDAKVSVFDHGFMYGYAVFETVLGADGKAVFLKEHLARLRKSARELGIRIPQKNAYFENAVKKVLAVNGLGNGNAYIRVEISRGEGGIGYTVKCQKPSVVVIAERLRPYPERMFEMGVKAITVETERVLPQAKSTNCVPNALARMNAKKAGAFEALMVDGEGFVREGTVSNVFAVKKGVIFTPKNKILRGITRQKVLGMATRLGLKAIEKDFKKREMLQSDECFITSTTMGIMPVTVVDGKKIGRGKPGPVTNKLMEKFNGAENLGKKQNA